MTQAGSFFRTEHPKLNLTEVYTWQQIEARSQGDTSEISSAYAFLQGLYPPGLGPRVEKKAIPPIALSPETQAFLDSLGDFALPGGRQVIPVHSVQRSHDYLFHTATSCAKVFNSIHKLETEDEDFLQYQASKQNILASISSELGVNITKIREAVDLRETYVIDRAVGNPVVLPQDLEEELDAMDVFYESVTHSNGDSQMELLCSTYFDQLRERLMDIVEL